MLSILFGAVASHMSLVSPTPRGSDEILSLQAPCGGYDSPGSVTTVQAKGNLNIKVADTNTKFVIRAGLGQASSFPIQIGTASFKTLGQYNIPYDFSSAVSAGLKDGGRAVIQVFLDGSHGALYTCADVIVTGLGTPSQPSASSAVPATSAAPGSSTLSVQSTSAPATASGSTAAQTPISSASSTAAATAAPNAGLMNQLPVWALLFL
ncbi:hypothetical protein EDD86DRAFT_208643 [Gorgonomyces haynaldii]|nr:hypothetical protein EDD86DRAFT_208643 [Gorgonomyces haynaldii]